MTDRQHWNRAGLQWDMYKTPKRVVPAPIDNSESLRGFLHDVTCKGCGFNCCCCVQMRQKTQDAQSLKSITVHERDFGEFVCYAAFDANHVLRRVECKSANAHLPSGLYLDVHHGIDVMRELRWDVRAWATSAALPALSINDQPKTAHDGNWAVEQLKAGKTVRGTVKRGGSTRDFKVLSGRLWFKDSGQRFPAFTDAGSTPLEIHYAQLRTWVSSGFSIVEDDAHAAKTSGKLPWAIKQLAMGVELKVHYAGLGGHVVRLRKNNNVMQTRRLDGVTWSNGCSWPEWQAHASAHSALRDARYEID